jgi:predicted dehydrogenase
MQQITVGVVGYGYWGPNFVRNFTEIDNVELRYICDLQQEHLDRHRNRYPTLRLTKDYDELLADKSLDAITIATPVDSHFALAKQALLAGKHVLLSKPMCRNSAQCEELIAIADERKLVLMVDHTFVYHGGVKLMKQLITDGEVGDLLYLSSVRVNLGIFQQDVNVLWDLGAHDFSILDYLVGRTPKSLHAVGKCHTSTGLEDIVFVTLEFDDNFIANFHVSWLSPVKVRQMIIGGTRKMLMFDDHRPIEKICIYDKGIEMSKPPQTERERYRALVQYRNGDMRAPAYDNHEALKTETLHFIDCIATGATPLSDGRSGLRVVKLLELADAALKGDQFLAVNA